jgi:hypothetical protein
MPSIENMGGAPEWDRAEGDGPVGKSIVVGMMFLAAGCATVGVDPNSAIAVAWQGVWSGQTLHCRPAPARCILPGPVTIVRGSISEGIRDRDQDRDQDRDLRTAWSIQSPMGNILMAACTDRSLL